MRNTDTNLIYADLTDKIIAAAYDVHNQRGSGFSEKVDENATAIKLTAKGLRTAQQTAISVFFEGKLLGEYFTDLLVEDAVIVELKAVAEVAKVHEAQLINYLKATGKRAGLLMNFGEKLKVVRRVL